MSYSKTHSMWKAGRLVYYEHGYRQRWLDAEGPDVVKTEFLCNEPYNSSALLRFTTHASSSGAVKNATTAPYRVYFDTHALANKDAIARGMADSFKLENNKPLYYGIKFKLANASSVGLIAGVTCDKSSADLLKSSGVVNSSVDGLYFISATGAKTLTPTCDSGASTTTTSTTSIGTSAMTIEIVWTGTTSSGVEFYASGALLGTVTSSIDQTANISPCFGIQGNNKHASVEWMRCIQLR